MEIMYRTQMKAESIDDASQFRYPCYVSEKLDGWRCLIVVGVMYTSGGKEFKPPVQERFKLIADSAHAAGLVLDGEQADHRSKSGIDSTRFGGMAICMVNRMGYRKKCYNLR
jgi:hypothetical protein